MKESTLEDLREDRKEAEDKIKNILSELEAKHGVNITNSIFVSKVKIESFMDIKATSYIDFVSIDIEL